MKLNIKLADREIYKTQRRVKMYILTAKAKIRQKHQKQNK